MSEHIVLVFDVGTQSVRGLLLDKHGITIRRAQDVYEEPYYSRNQIGRAHV